LKLNSISTNNDMKLTFIQIWRMVYLTLPSLCLVTNGLAAKTYNRIDANWNQWKEGQFENIGLQYPQCDLQLVPSIKPIAHFDEPIIWKAKLDQQGHLIVATGGDHAQLWRVQLDQTQTLLHHADDPIMRAIGISKAGSILFGTSPSGCIYQIKHAHKAPQLVVKLPVKYIWDMVYDEPNQGFYIATGMPASVYFLPDNYAPDQPLAPIVELKDQSHISTLAVTSSTVYCGTADSGLIYAFERSNPKVLRVLANQAGEEITSIVARPHGEVYFSTFKETQSEAEDGIQQLIGCFLEQAAAEAAKKPKQGDSQADDADGSLPLPHHKIASGTVYKIDPSGMIQGIWGILDAGVFSLNGDHQSLTVGSSAKGKLFSIQNNQNWSLIAQLPSGGAITQIVPTPQKGIYIASSNPARIFYLSPEKAATGSYTSAVFDAKQIAVWGKAYYVSDPLNQEKSIRFQSRSGNVQDPDDTWSNWADLHPNGLLGSPTARYLQYRLNWGSAAQDLAIKQVRFFYTYPNVPPAIHHATVTPLGVQVQAQDILASQPLELKHFLQEGGFETMTDTAATRRLAMRATGEIGFVTCAWIADDPNGDVLSYSLSIRKIGDLEWAILTKDLSDSIYSFSTRGLQSGYYELKIQASDALSNGIPHALKTDYVTHPFIIDGQAPQITLIQKIKNGNTVTIQLKAEDNWSPLWAAHYSLDGGIPQAVTPDDGLFDSLSKTFTIQFNHLCDQPHSLLFEAIDECGNSAIFTVNF